MKKCKLLIELSICVYILIGCQNVVEDQTGAFIGEMPFREEQTTTQKQLVYYTQLIEETISIEQYLGHHSTSKESGREKQIFTLIQTVMILFFYHRNQKKFTSCPSIPIMNDIQFR